MSKSFAKVLKTVYPELIIEESQFMNVPCMWASFYVIIKNINNYKVGYFKDEDNRRKFLVDFAKERGFDHLNPDSWYPIQVEDILMAKVLF